MNDTMRKRIVSGLVALGMVMSPAGAGLGTIPAFAEDGIATVNTEGGSEGGSEGSEGGSEGGEGGSEGSEGGSEGGEEGSEGGEGGSEGSEGGSEGGEEGSEGGEGGSEGEEGGSEGGEEGSETSGSYNTSDQVFEKFGDDVLPYYGIFTDVGADSEMFDGMVYNAVNAYTPSIYASTDGYNGLTSAEKAIYSALYSCAVRIDTSTESYKSKDEIHYTDGGTKPLYFFADIENYKTTDGMALISDSTEDQVERAYSAMCYDNPQLFWLAHAWTAFGYYDSGNNFICRAVAIGTEVTEYATGSKRQAAKTALFKEVNEVLDGAEMFANDYSKEWYVHDYLCNKTIYDPNLGGSRESPYDHDVTGLFLHGVCVCESYAKSTQLLLNALDIDVLYVVGMAYSNGQLAGGHAWNQIGIDGEWYNYDATWNDLPEKYWDTVGQYNYDYFNVPDSAFNYEHHAFEDYTSMYDVHTCTADTYSYDNHEENFKTADCNFVVSGNGTSKPVISIESALSYISRCNKTTADYVITYTGENPEDGVTVKNPVTVAAARSVTFSGASSYTFSGGLTAQADVVFATDVTLGGTVKVGSKTVTVNGSTLDLAPGSVISISKLELVNGEESNAIVFDKGALSVNISNLVSSAAEDFKNTVRFTSSNVTVGAITTTGKFDLCAAKGAHITVTGKVTSTDEEKTNLVYGIYNDNLFVPWEAENGTTLITANTAAASAFKSEYEAIITINGVKTNDIVSYAVYKDGKEVKVTLPRVNVLYGDDKSSYGSFATFDDAVAAVNADKNLVGTPVVFELRSDVESAKFALPTKVKSVTITSEESNTITLKGAASVSVGVDLTLDNVAIETTNTKGYTFTTSKNLTLNNFMSSTLTALKGGSASELTLDSMFGGCDITGFGVMTVNDGFDAGSDITVNVGTLVLNGRGDYDIYLSSDTTAFTVKSIVGNNVNGMAEIVYGEGAKPITVTGSASGYILISTYDRNGFTDGQKVLTAKTADMSVFELNSSNVPQDGFDYVLTRKGSDLCVGKAVFEFAMSDPETSTEYAKVKMATWSDFVSSVNAKNNGFEYTVYLLDNVDVGGALTMPKAGTFSKLKIRSDSNYTYELTFTGNITLTGNTCFEGLVLSSVKVSKGDLTRVKFSISAGNNDLTLNGITWYSEAGISGITSKGNVSLSDVTVSGNLTAGSLYTSGSFVTGNVTVSNRTSLDYLCVDGNFSTGELWANENSYLRVVKGKKFTIGKGGFSADSDKLTLEIINADFTKYTPKSLETIGTISGTYAKNIQLAAECGGETLTVVRSGNNLVAAPSENLVKMTRGEKSYLYSSYEDAIKDITSMADPDAVYYIYFSGETTIPKLTMPAAKKYRGLFFATEDESAVINTNSDLSITGSFYIGSNVTVNKLGKNGSITDMNINVGTNTLFLYDNAQVSYKDGASHIGKLSGSKGSRINILNGGYVEISGAVSADDLEFYGELTLGDKSSLNVSNFKGDGVLKYPFKNASKMKFGNIWYDGSLKFDSTDDTVIDNGTYVANITGTLDTFIRVGDMPPVWTDEDINVAADGYQAVRSGNKLVVVNNINNAVRLVNTYSNQEYYYDTFESAMKDITRMNSKDARYAVYIKGDMTVSKIALPAANKYAALDIRTVDPNAPVTITTASDLALTGDLYIPANVTVNKTDKSGKIVPMNVNTGNYYLICNGYLSKGDGVSQVGNISGKGKINLSKDVNITGNVNVGTFYALSNVTLSDKSSFTSATFFAGGGSFNYPAKNAAKIKLGDIFKSGAVIFPMFGEGKQVAAVTGDFPDGAIIFGNEHSYDELYKAVRTGSKIIIRKSADAVIMTDGDGVDRAYSYPEDAITDIARINNASGEYTINLTEGRGYAKLPLPAKGKYKSVKFVSDVEGGVYLDVTSDITLTGNLIIGDNVTLRRVKSLTDPTVKPLKITAPKGSGFYATTSGTGVIMNASGDILA
ncbi:MAG: hypothetical protein MRZ61_10695 [Oscillospiraceae bacterium]|nr:hypothetical protein [Oscillospiraceae bacterium]